MRPALAVRIVLILSLLLPGLSGCGGGGLGGTTSSTPTQATSSDATASTTSSTATPVASSTTSAPTATPTPAATPTPTPSAAAVGDPLPGLSATDQAKFAAGLAAFRQPAQPGVLGPVFNNNSCVACHNGGAPGGAGRVRVTRFGKTTNGVFDALVNEGGSLLQANAVPGTPRETVPADADVTTPRRTTPLFGDGLIEAIPDSQIIAFAQAQAAAHPAQAGQVCFVTSPSDGQQHVGRFGWKCQQATVLDFAGDALDNEMGVSNALFPFENQSNAAPLDIPLGQVEDQPDAQGTRIIDKDADFMRFLAMPPRATPDPTGQALFESTGCAVCHNPSYTTVSPIATLNGQTVAAYSDFLLHDVGTGDGIVQGNAPANKIRTSPLIGMSLQPTFLHDGSVNTVAQAIARHGGEAASSVSSFNALSAADRATLLQFVQNL
jgi:CxxC motif-containing protein (DUF1111 family)